MTISMLDQMPLQFTCAQCGYNESINIGRFDNLTSWACDACGHATDLGQEPIRSELEILRDRAIQIDLQALERGESIKRIGD